MADLFKKIFGIKNLQNSSAEYVVSANELGALSRRNASDLYKVGWTDEFEELDSSTPNSEGTPIDLKTSSLDSTYERHIKYVYAYDDDSTRPIGVIQAIGTFADLSSDQWETIDNRRVVITAQDGCWFGIANNVSESDSDKVKRIITQTNGNIEKCIKAVLSYDAVRAIWILESYVVLEDWQRYWFKTYTFSASGVSSPKEFDLPDGAGLPYEGYYLANVYCDVEELDGTPAKVNTASPHTLHIKSRTSGTDLLIDKSGNYFPGAGPSPATKWFNNSLQGSAIIEVTGTDCEDRGIVVKVTLPNTATYRNIANGYLHLKYLGKQIGNNC